MSYEISRYTGGGTLARQTGQALDVVDAQAAIVIRKIQAMAYAGEVAVNRAMLLQLVLKLAEDVAPNGSEAYAGIVKTATLQIEGLLNQLGYRLG